MSESLVCRACRHAGLELVVSLGDLPLANSFRETAAAALAEPRYPLTLVRCPQCALLQLTKVVPPEELFRDYLYFSSYSTTMLAHAKRIVERMVSEEKLGPPQLAVEVASNDGYLLQYYKDAGVQVLGIEPAINVAEVAERERGVPTVREFFGEALARELVGQGKRADVMHANNVLAHVADLNGFVEGFHTLLAKDGVLVSESPYARPFLDHGEFDTIYHEHLYYYSLTALDRLFRSHGLVIERCEELPIHGGSLRIFVRRKEVARIESSVEMLLAEEVAWGIDTPAPYGAFSSLVGRITADVQKTVRGLVAKGHRVCAYGAAAKGTILLNVARLDTSVLTYVCDRSPHKQGRFMPGVGLPIVDPKMLVEDRPDYCLLLAWNFADEILEQQAEYRRGGGKFIVPLPEVRIL